MQCFFSKCVHLLLYGLHTIEKLFKCRDGDKVSSHKYNLNCHIMKLHTDGETINFYADYGRHIPHTAIWYPNNYDNIPADRSDTNLSTHIGETDKVIMWNMALFSKSNQNLLNLLTIHAGESQYDTYMLRI